MKHYPTSRISPIPTRIWNGVPDARTRKIGSQNMKALTANGASVIVIGSLVPARKQKRNRKKISRMTERSVALKLCLRKERENNAS